MKNLIKKSKVAALLLVMVGFSSCDAVLDQEKTDFGTGPVLAQFTNSSISANFIKDGTEQTYNIPLTIVGGRNLALNEPIQVTVSADASSTAVSGTEYTLETTTFTIPAGEMTVNVPIKVATSSLDPFDAKTLVLKIDSSSKGVSENNKTSVVLQAVCELDLNNFVGTYTTNDSGVSKQSTVTLGALPNSLLIKTGSEKIYIELNTDVTNPTITYVEEGAVLSVSSTYGDIWATTVTAEQSTYGSCDYSLNLEYKRCVSIGCFSGTKTKTMVKN
ncbi:hypothetical protein HNP99_001392 [Flavobacterium sp. 28A]|uniref:hypothetical protein n=1 Tax=Flavobacterium sp. 28A TaxID=2735895 RepID=UPI00156F9ACB|nr:hypothetical protein [Flavobacterium sp. 28A]NRT15045.1 hypothetical protein [Flavobacterium sp. 28A]